MVYRVSVCAAALLLLSLLPVAHARALQPELDDLGTLGGSTSTARGINGTGMVVGDSHIAGDKTYHAFVWTPATGMVDITPRSTGAARAVNDVGMVVGSVEDRKGVRAFFWTATDGLVELGTLGGSFSQALSVNRTGVVVGNSRIAGDGVDHAFLWTSAGGMVDLGTLGGISSIATGINEAGIVVGGSYLPGNGGSHAFSWTADGGMVDLGTLGGTSSQANAINNAGAVVGGSYIAGNGAYRAFLWTQQGGMTNLGTLGGSTSVATGINEAGEVVGYSTTAGNGPEHAFSWTAAGGMIDLGTLSTGSSSFAFGVNDGGVVVGTSASTPIGVSATHAVTWNAPNGVGTISVATDLPSATFTIAGPEHYTGAGQSFAVWNAPAGSYTITYGPVAPYQTPAPQNQVLAAGGTVAFTGRYITTPGQVFLTVNKTGTGSGSVTSSPSGIDCGPTCEVGFKAGTHLKLQAVADPGSTFVGWNDSICSGTGTCSFAISADRTIGATFVPTPQGAANRIIYVGVCGAGYAFDNACSLGVGWYDPNDLFPWVDPLDESQLTNIGMTYSGLDAIGLRIKALFPTSVTLVTGFSSANVVLEVLDAGLIRNNVASVVDFVAGVYRPGDRVYLVGHSAGGEIVQEAAKSLLKKKIPVAMTAHIDSVASDGEVSANVARALNYYYPWDLLCTIAGQTEISAARRSGTVVSNLAISAPLGPDQLDSFCGGHKNMDNEPLVWRPILNFILGIPEQP